MAALSSEASLCRIVPSTRGPDGDDPLGESIAKSAMARSSSSKSSGEDSARGASSSCANCSAVGRSPARISSMSCRRRSRNTSSGRESRMSVLTSFTRVTASLWPSITRKFITSWLTCC
eukprot:Mycagemm_TRINITY_DN8791_c0_g1::TRINITY_DN8791_c0_g1_i2::g.2866::m.2866 type:complete len:119 gc:universal TRINITY_DN8791_c0_g1_i2:304-660(+)